VGKPERKGPLGRPKCGWDFDVGIDLVEIGWEIADWIDLAWNRDKWQVFVKAVMNRRVPQNGGKFLTE
jgi:hypothetical protein